MDRRVLLKETCIKILSWLPGNPVPRCLSLGKSFHAATQSRSLLLSQARRAK